MQIKLSQNATFLLNRLKSVKDFKTDLELATFLGVKQNTLSSWKSRGSVDYDLIISKCDTLDLNWLIRGDSDSLPGIKKLPRYKGKLVSVGVPYFENQPVSAGDFFTFFDKETPTAFIDLPQIRDCLAILPVYGNSMKGIVEPGDLIAIKEVNGRTEFNPDSPHLIITEEYRMIKYLEVDKSDDSIIWARSTNHEKIKLSVENIKKIYAIKCVIRFY